MKKANLRALLMFMLVSAVTAQPARPESDTAGAWALFHAGRRAEAGELASKAYTKAANKNERGEALLIQALAASDGEVSAALLDKFLSQHKGHPLEWRAEMELGLHGYALGTYAQASRHFGRAVALRPPKREAVKARYWQALSLLGAGSFAQSRKEFESVKADDAGTGLSDAASLGAADCLRQEGGYASALAEYTRLIARPGGSDWLPQALYGAGLCLDKLKRESEARQVYSRLVKEFPSSFEATAARGKLKGAAPAASQKAAAAGYTIQAGAFSQEANAMKLVSSLTQQGVKDLSVVREERGGRVLFIVYLGEFPTREAAQQTSKELSARLGLSCSVVAR